MKYQILLNIVIVIWLFTIERRLKLINAGCSAAWLFTQRLYREVFGTTEDENEKYNKPCPHNPEVMCVQMPIDEEIDDTNCHACPEKDGQKEGSNDE